MAWIRQYSWFVLAAFCLVGSLIMVWTTDVELPVSATPPRTLPDHSRIVRNLQDLNKSGTVETHAPPLLQTMNEGRSREMVMLAPAGVPGRWATPMNTESKLVPREHFTPAGFLQPESAATENPVWFSGTIEDAGDANDGIHVRQ
jgi:hypothetical protein